jgi:hypothetical protein
MQNETWIHVFQENGAPLTASVIIISIQLAQKLKERPLSSTNVPWINFNAIARSLRNINSCDTPHDTTYYFVVMNCAASIPNPFTVNAVLNGICDVLFLSIQEGNL